MIVGFDDLPAFSSYVLVDGAFDPVHDGHIAYLNAARALYNGTAKLLCSVASDDQIRAKGREPLLPHASRVAVMEALCDAVYAKDRPMEDVIRKMRPETYAKGWDWIDKLPSEQIAALRDVGGKVFYTATGFHNSSIRSLRAWALKDAEQSLDRLQVFMDEQVPVTKTWEPVTDFSLGARTEIEGKHPELIRDVLQPDSVLDVGCGPDGHLIRLLQKVGVVAAGLDIQDCRANDLCVWRGDISVHGYVDALGKFDVVICREVLEHLSVYQIPRAVTNLFRLSSRLVYITTRFSDQGVFDAATDFDTDPTHITCLSQPFLRALCVLSGGKRRRDLEQKLDWQNKGRVLVYEVF